MCEVVPSFEPRHLREPDFKSFPTLEEANEAARLHKEEVARRTIFQCVGNLSTGKGCGKVAKVEDSRFIQTHWYVEPFGCGGGDYYQAGEGVAVCPNCGRENRLYDSPHLNGLKRYFKEVEDRYDR
jgi:hypothetical protein